MSTTPFSSQRRSIKTARLTAFVALASVTAISVAAPPDRDVTVQGFAPVSVEANAHAVSQIGTSSKGGPIERMQLSGRVNYADLDLTTYAGATELYRRIDAAVRQACERLDEQYPLSASIGSRSGPDCLKSARATADRQARELVAAAERQSAQGKLALSK